MKLKPMPVGSLVTIRKTSQYYGVSNANPAHMRGAVRDIKDWGKPYVVKWGNGETNAYSRTDLRYWKSQDKPIKAVAEKPEKKAKPTLEEVVDAAEKECVRKGITCTARYAFISEERKSFYVSSSTACHAAVLNRNYDGLDGKPSHIVTVLHENSNTKFKSDVGERTTYFNWLFNESPWREAFVTKDGEAAVKRGFALTTTKISGPILQGALVATRHPHENARRVKEQCYWMEQGLSGNQAFILASCVHLSEGNMDVSVDIHGGGHYAISPHEMTEKSFANFLTNTVVTEEASYYEGGRGYGVHSLFGERASKGKEFITRLLKASQKGEVGTKNTNPFAKALERDVSVFKTALLIKHIKEKGFNV